MILPTIFLISLVQGILNLIAAALRFKPLRYLILVTVLIAYFFILPPYFYPEMKPDRVVCGLPIFAINMGFWIFGSLAAVFTQILTPVDMWEIDRGSIVDNDDIVDAEID